MVDKIRKYFALILLIATILFFYSPFLISLATNNVKVPMPTDAIVGLYHPFRDFYADDFPNGIPFKNFLITDPVRQTFVWKKLGIDLIKNGTVPSWNPYEMAGKPLAANFQSATFYPLNILLFVFPSVTAWSFFVLLQTLLSAIFMYFYLRNLKLNTVASTLGASSFSFCAFSISWLEWGTIGHTALWLPLILLSIDKLIAVLGGEIVNRKKQIEKMFARREFILWGLVYIFSLCSSFFAGHLQTFIYAFLLSFSYTIFRCFKYGQKLKIFFYFLLFNISFLLFTFVQWFPTLQLILKSARATDQNFSQVEGWFVPFQHLIQYIAPDFFGNPATLNYWGTWNYAELNGYIGLVPLTLVLFAFFRKNSTVYFFSIVGITALIFSLPTVLSKIPYQLEIPFISSAQPTRLLFVVSFCLSVISAYGVSYIFKTGRFHIKHIAPLGIVFIVLFLLWIITYFAPINFFQLSQNADVAQRNLIFPTIIFSLFAVLVIIILRFKNRVGKEIVMILILILTLIELTRFAQKFTPFSDASYLFPLTKAINFIKEDDSLFRVAVTDNRIIPPNFFTYYKIQTIEGYDPLYLKGYAEFITASERGVPNIDPPYGFNRIITPHNYNSQLFDFLNTKYVLSLDEITSPKLTKVFEEGQTKVYKNSNAFERAFFVEKVVSTSNVFNAIFENDLRKAAILEGKDYEQKLSIGNAEVISYKEDEVTISTQNEGEGFLVISDVYYPTWKVYIDGKEEKIETVNHSFRGVFVPKGRHTVKFKNSIL